MSSKLWLVTGASRGLGFEITKSALAAGHTVVACRRTSDNSSSSNELEKLGAHWVQLDVAGSEVERTISDVVERHGKINVLVNNAGYGLGGTVEDTSIDQVRSVFDVNFFGPLRTVRSVIPSMRAQGGGTIVNIGSRNGIGALPGLGAYSASKHALEGLSEALQTELAPFQIRVLLVEPGALATNFTDSREAAVFTPPNDAYKGTITEQVINGVTNVSGYKSQARSAEKAALRIVEAVDGTGMLAGREIGLRLPLGETGAVLGEKAKQFAELSETLRDVYESI